MNTKGTKFLAVLAVLAMAFAAFAVIAPAEENDAALVGAVDVPEDGVVADEGKYFVNSAKTVTAAAAAGATFYLNGTSAVLTIGANVTAAIQYTTDTTAATVDSENSTLLMTGVVAAADKTVVVKVTAAGKLSVNGEAAAIASVESANTVKVENQLIVGSATAVANLGCAAYFQNDGEAALTYDGTAMPTYVLDNAGDKLVLFKGNATIMGGINSVKLVDFKDAAFSSAAGLTFTYPGEVVTVKGTLLTGAITVSAGTMTVDDNLTVTDGDSEIQGASNAEMAAGVLADGMILTNAPSDTYYVILGHYTHPDKNPKVNCKLTIDAAAVLTIPAKSTFTYGNKEEATVADEVITLKGKIDVWGTLKGVTGATAAVVPTITKSGDGLLTIRAGAEVSGFVDAAGASTITPAAIKEMPAVDAAELEGRSGTMDSSATINNAEIPAGKALKVPEGITLTVTGMLVLNGLDLTVEGTLIVEDGAMIGVNTGNIILGDKGTIQNNGIIGKYNPATIKTANGDTKGIVTMTGINGVVFGVSSKVLALSGNIVPIAGANVSTVTFNGVKFNKDVTIGEGVVATIATNAATLAGKTMTIDGVLVPTVALNLDAGSTVIVNGYVAEAASGIVAKTTPYAGVEKAEAAAGTMTFVATQGTAHKDAGEPENVATDLTGYTISVVKTEFKDEDVDMYTQYVFISGTLGVTPTLGTGYSLLTANGGVNAKITATAAGGSAPLMIASGESFTQSIPGAYLTMAADSYIIAEGTLTSATEFGAGVGQMAGVVGATYAITTGTAPNDVTTYYAVDYNTGLGGIAGYDTKTVTLVSLNGYTAELAASLTILDKEIVDYASIDGANATILTIPEGVVLTVNAGGTFDAAKILKKLDGKIIVMNDGDCVPLPALYQVYSEDDDENITYCGFVTALSEASAGDTITLTGAYAADSLSIPEGINVEVGTTGTLTVKKTLTVAAGATLTVTGNIVVGDVELKTKNTKVTNNGTIDLSATALPATFYSYQKKTDGTDDTVENQKAYALQIVSNGNVIFRTTQTFPAYAVLVGVTYVDGTTTVLTSLENALEEEAEVITIPGEYTSDATIDLGDATLNVTGKATIATLKIQGGQVNVTGDLTGTVDGVYGENGATSVALTGFVGTISDKAVADEYTFAIATMTAGSLEVKNGTATVTGVAITVEDKQTLKVDSGAELVINEAVALTLTGSMDVAGKLTIAKDKSLTVAGDKLTISGEVDAIGDLTIDKSTVSGNIVIKGDFIANGDMKLTGTITVDDSEESVATAQFSNVVVGASVLGAAPAIEGKAITLAAGKFITQFPGATLGADTVKNLKKTEFYLNDVLYVTAYANNGEVNDVEAAPAVITTAIKVQGYDMTGVNIAANWKDNTGAAIDNATKVGEKAKVYFNGVQLTCQVVVSSTTGTSIFVDGVKYDSGKTLEGISVGKHTITVSINPGYKGTTTTTFNGKAVTDSFEVTSDMVGPTAKYVLSVTGDIVIDPGDVPEPEPAAGMSLTEILLIVLVILIAIMVVVLLIRLNRS